MQETDENFKLCQQFALSKIRNHKHLTVNSHEIRRRISGLCERFTIVNRERYADRFVQLTNLLINHPLCIDHCTTDIQWSIIQFLFELSYNPVNTLLHTNAFDYCMKDKSVNDDNFDSIADSMKMNLIEELKVDNINITRNDDSSDLSVRNIPRKIVIKNVSKNIFYVSYRIGLILMNLSMMKIHYPP